MTELGRRGQDAPARDELRHDRRALTITFAIGLSGAEGTRPLGV